MKLSREQQNKLLEWAAEGLRRTEINERAAEFDPPFEVEWNQLKHARRRVSKRFSELREDFEKDAVAKGLSQKLLQGRICLEIYLTPKIHADAEAALAEEGHKADLSRLIDGLLSDWLIWRHI